MTSVGADSQRAMDQGYLYLTYSSSDSAFFLINIFELLSNVWLLLFKNW